MSLDVPSSHLSAPEPLYLQLSLLRSVSLLLFHGLHKHSHLVISFLPLLGEPELYFKPVTLFIYVFPLGHYWKVSLA